MSGGEHFNSSPLKWALALLKLNSKDLPTHVGEKMTQLAYLHWSKIDIQEKINGT